MNKEKSKSMPDGEPKKDLNPLEMMLRDKRIMDAYIRGEIYEDDLQKKGIKLGK